MSDIERLAIDYMKASQHYTRLTSHMASTVYSTEADRQKASREYKAASEDVTLTYNRLRDYVNTFYLPEMKVIYE
jgi:hypothetical protein